MQKQMIGILLTLISGCLSIMAQNSAADTNVGGAWQISWEARIGTERGTLQLQQNASHIVGKLQDRLGDPSFSGNIHGQNIDFKIPFEKAHPFTLSFTGKVEGNKMSGKFEIEGMADGYDWHGENAHPTDYSWAATRGAEPSDHAKQNSAAAMGAFPSASK